MNESQFFNGQIVRSQDLNFNNSGFSSTITDLASNISNQSGGILEGLEIYASSNGMSLLINPGTFYSSTGELATLFSQQTFTNLNPTPVIANQNTVLVIYLIISTQNSDPNPVAPNLVYSAVNIQTGVTQPVRTYNVASVVISNPIFPSEISNFNGVILGALTVSSTGQILSIDTSVKQDFILGGAIDVTTQQIIPNAIPNNFITNRMIGELQITSDKFTNNTIASPAIALYDGSSSNWIASGSNFVSGSGVGTLQLKSQAVTQSTMSYSGSVSGFSSRNRLINSSFEQGITGWSVWSGSSAANGPTSGVTISTNNSLYGNQSAALFSNYLSSTPLPVGITQTVNFNDNLLGKPISAYVSIQASSPINLAISGNTGILGQLDFLSTGGIVISSQSVQFGYSGISTSWTQIYSAAPVYPTVDCTQVSFTIFGSFDNTFYIDGAFLGETALLPAYDVNPNEYIALNVNFNDVNGTISTPQLGLATVGTNQIANSAVTSNQIAPNAVGTSQISNGAVTNAQLANNSVGTNQIIPNSIGTNQLASGSVGTGQLNSTVNNLFPTAWGSFNGTNMSFYNSYNINTGICVKQATGLYTIVFLNPTANSNYAVIGSIQASITVGNVTNLYALDLVSPGNIKTFLLRIRDVVLGQVDSPLINFVVFGGNS